MVFVSVGILGKLKAIADGIVQFIIGFFDPGVEGIGLKGLSNSDGEDAHKPGLQGA